MKKISPLRYPGGKSQIYDYIKELIIANNATTYIEPYILLYLTAVISFFPKIEPRLDLGISK